MRKFFIFFTIVVLVAVFAVAFKKQRDELTLYRNRQWAATESAMGTLTRNLKEIETGLHQGVTMSSPKMVAAAATDIVAASASAKTAIDSVPQYEEDLYPLSRYIAQVGDYCKSLAGDTIKDGKLPAGAREMLQNMLKVTEGLLDCVTEAEADGTTQSVLAAASKAATYDKLYYDGAMSDHMLDPCTYAGLYELEEVDMATAQQAAAEFLGVEPGQLSQSTTDNGNLPTYGFEMDKIYIEVTKVGGIVARMVNGREVGEATIDPAQARANAAAFVKSAGYSDMTETEYATASGTVTVTLCYETGEVLYYPDAIVIDVALDGGDIVGFDATKYLRCHTETRTPQKASILKSAGSKYAPEGYTMSSSRYAVIASDGGIESNALELSTASGDYNYLYYIDSSSGDELSMSRVFDDDGGHRID
ncbi:MAG TPA: PepSY1/2 domain-containing protein [Terriglobales bacterium]|nr:PepSY1/2 domain-containing protein [Terriglobales bacterium]